MMKARTEHSRTAVAVALSLLTLLVLFAPVAVAAAPEAKLVGQLATNDAGRFVLLEEETGNAILLESDRPQELADHQSARVSLTGQGSGTRETFRVATLTVEPAVESAGAGGN